jgi:hypothetical protein
MWAAATEWPASFTFRCLQTSFALDRSPVKGIVRSSACPNGGTYTVVVRPYTKAGSVSSARFTHYSQRRTTENMLGLRCRARACQARSMRRAFGL